MPLHDLTGHERDMVRRCFVDILQGGRFDLAQADVRLGATVEELQAYEREWPPDDSDAAAASFVAINNVLNEICHGPDRPRDAQWASVLGATPEELRATYTKWARSHGLSSTGVR